MGQTVRNDIALGKLDFLVHEAMEEKKAGKLVDL